MTWASGAAVDEDLDAAVGRLVADVRRQSGESPLDVGFLFVGRPHAERAAEVADRVRRELSIAHVVGCTAGGVIGGGREHEGAPAVSLLAGDVGKATVRVVAIEDDDLPDADAGPAAWHALLGVPPAKAPSFVVLADPTTIRPDALLAGLDFAYPSAVKVGGLASGADRPGGQTLFAGDRSVRAGAVVFATTGGVALTPAVAQGCRPIGATARITACEGHLLKELDGVPAVDALRSTLAGVSERDRDLARTSLFLGFETDSFGPPDGAWLIRNIAGADRSGGLYVGETLRSGRRVRFHVRDRVTSAEDLDRTLERAHEDAPQPKAALLFSCLGRGMPLYGEPDHDTRRFHERFPGVPLGGFFCYGEIGPVGGATYLHGYTSSFGLLRAVDGR